MYIYVYICIYIYIYIYVCIYIYVYICIYICTAYSISKSSMSVVDAAFIYIFSIDYLVTGYSYFLFFVELTLLLEKSSKLTKQYPMVCSGFFSCFRFHSLGFA